MSLNGNREKSNLRKVRGYMYILFTHCILLKLHRLSLRYNIILYQLYYYYIASPSRFVCRRRRLLCARRNLSDYSTGVRPAHSKLNARRNNMSSRACNSVAMLLLLTTAFFAIVVDRTGADAVTTTTATATTEPPSTADTVDITDNGNLMAFSVVTLPPPQKSHPLPLPVRITFVFYLLFPPPSRTIVPVSGIYV